MATRERIVAAAAPLFVRNGYVETTMADLARAAGVAVQTLYLSFGSKAAVLEAVLAPEADDQPNEWLAALRAEPSGPAALRRYVVHVVAQVERSYPLDAALRAAAADPDPAELLKRSRRAALATHAQAVDELAEKPGFTTRISLQRATEVVAALLSPETYGLLVVSQGWTMPDWAEWVGAHVAVDLFPAERA
jgi:AcrR family transcriptional regulator